MKESTKAILVFGGGALLFFMLRPYVFKKKTTATPATDEKPAAKPLSPAEQAQQIEDAKTALTAYKMAVDAGEDESALSDLNRILVQEYGLRVQTVARTGAYIVTDMQGNEVPLA